MVVGVPCRKTLDGEECDGEELKGGVIKFEEGPMQEDEMKAAMEVVDVVPRRRSARARMVTKHTGTRKVARAAVRFSGARRGRSTPPRAGAGWRAR